MVAMSSIDGRRKWVDVLMVEDSEQDLQLALRSFRKANFLDRVQVVRDGAEALNFIFCQGPMPAARSKTCRE